MNKLANYFKSLLQPTGPRLVGGRIGLQINLLSF